jgi:penicillin amidase
MKRLRKIIFSAIALVLTFILAVLIYLTSQKPKYSGVVQLEGMQKPVEVLYDYYGIPHIYALTEEDAYFALGYTHAQDRLLQMEMIRRVASGRLSEVFGPEFVKTDVFFRTLGLARHARASSRKYLNGSNAQYEKVARAYTAGINQFMHKGRIPAEFVMLGIPLQEFTTDDLYLTLEYLTFNFAMGLRTDALMSYINSRLGPAYFKDLIATSPPLYTVPVKMPDTLSRSAAFNTIDKILETLPVPPLLGSNAWAVSPSKSGTGKVLFANDTHIGYSQPCVWYEAHLEYPGNSVYGNYAAGMPFAVVGHTRQITWGLTMLENDDLDFYKIRLKPGDSTMYWFDGNWRPLEKRGETIQVKNSEPVQLSVYSTHHGPLMQHAMPEWKGVTSDAVALWWTQLRFPCNLMEVCYQLNHSKDIRDARYAVSGIISPGLNIIYGDAEGNIALWTAGRLIRRNSKINSWLLQDGTKHQSEPQGYYDFTDNPSQVNPARGFVHSANQQMDTMAGGFRYPGYYTPDDRALRIETLLSDRTSYNIEDFQRINTDTESPITPLLTRIMIDAVIEDVIHKTPQHYQASKTLLTWDGDHQLRDVAPTIYYKLLYHVLHGAMADELGEQNFKAYLATHTSKTFLNSFLKNEHSVWWNDISTKEVQESRNTIISKAYDQTITELLDQLGKEVDSWEWGRVHFVEHVHPIGRKKPFNMFFNAGPYPVPGGPEVINQIAMPLNAEGVYKATYGPAMRIVLDFADIENSKSILPTGQSGNVMSRHYYDQAIMYNTGKSRKQKMNRKEIENNKMGRLLLQPMRRGN